MGVQTRRVFTNLFVLGLLVSSISCDQVSKNLVRSKIDFSDRIEIVRNHIILLKTENTGAFLGLGESLTSPFKFILLSLIPILALGAGLIFLFKGAHLTKWTQLGLCFMIGGGIGNLYDRIVLGSVTDFLHIDFGIFETGIFNLADVSIMAGMFILVFKAQELKELAKTDPSK